MPHLPELGSNLVAALAACIAVRGEASANSRLRGIGAAQCCVGMCSVKQVLNSGRHATGLTLDVHNLTHGDETARR